MVATLPGRTPGLGLVTEPLLQDLNLDRVSYANMNLWATLLGALVCFPAGWAIERVGLRWITAVAGVNALGLALHQVEHRLDHPRGGEDLPVVGDSLFGLYKAHEQIRSEHISTIYCGDRRCPAEKLAIFRLIEKLIPRGVQTFTLDVYRTEAANPQKAGRSAILA